MYGLKRTRGDKERATGKGRGGWEVRTKRAKGGKRWGGKNEGRVGRLPTKILPLEKVKEKGSLGGQDRIFIRVNHSAFAVESGGLWKRRKEGVKKEREKGSGKKFFRRGKMEGGRKNPRNQFCSKQFGGRGKGTNREEEKGPTEGGKK